MEPGNNVCLKTGFQEVRPNKIRTRHQSDEHGAQKITTPEKKRKWFENEFLKLDLEILKIEEVPGAENNSSLKR
jgi:hypothetical protein